MAFDHVALGVAAVLPTDPDLAASLAAGVAREIRSSCCEFSAGDLSAGRTLCYPADWPVRAPEGVPEEGYQAGRANAAGSCARYNHGIIERFQEAAGLDPDGSYGPATVGALKFFGVRNPPAAVFGHGEIPYVVADVPLVATVEDSAEEAVDSAFSGFAVLGILGLGAWYLLRRTA